MNRKKKNPVNSFVTTAICDQRYAKLDTKITEILHILKGKPSSPDDLGLMGHIRDINRDRRWMLGIVTLIAIPIVLLLVKELLLR